MPMVPMISLRSATLALSLVVVAAQFPSRVRAQAQGTTSELPDPSIDVTLENPRSDKLSRVRFSATPGTYVTVISVSSNGKVEVLYPASPDVTSAFVTSSRTVTLPRLTSTSRLQLQRDIYAFASFVPFNFAKVSDGSGWNSLHLSNYGIGSGENIALAFAAEISDPAARVVMAPAITESGVLVTRQFTPATRWLATFHNKPCPYLSTVTGSRGGFVSCSGVGRGQATIATRRTPQPNPAFEKKTAKK
jgi:hypothetical protein